MAIVIALPMASFVPVTAIMVIPTSGHVVVAVARANIVTIHPDMAVIAPGPVARRPDITDARLGYYFVARRRRRDIDFDIGARGGKSRGNDCTKRQSGAQHSVSNCHDLLLPLRRP